MRTNLTERQIFLAIRDLGEFHRVLLTFDQMDEFIAESHPEFELVKELSAYVGTAQSLDTYTREILISALTDRLGIREWPYNAEGKEVFDAFWLEFSKKATEQGYKIIPF